MKPFSLKVYIKNPKDVVTRDGRAVKIYCTDYIDADSRPVIAKIEGDTYSNSFREDGRYVDYEETNNDLFFAPEKHEKWVNLYKDAGIVYASMDTFDTKKEAEAASCSTCIATVKIEWEE